MKRELGSGRHENKIREERVGVTDWGEVGS